jgi:hypothetical protein
LKHTDGLDKVVLLSGIDGDLVGNGRFRRHSGKTSMVAGRQVEDRNSAEEVFIYSKSCILALIEGVFLEAFVVSQ